jgi:hypothetical protein
MATTLEDKAIWEDGEVKTAHYYVLLSHLIRKNLFEVFLRLTELYY